MILVAPQRPILQIDFAIENLYEVIVLLQVAVESTEASYATTESKFTMILRINGLVTLMHLARQSNNELFQIYPYVSLLNINGVKYFLTSFQVTLKNIRF